MPQIRSTDVAVSAMTRVRKICMKLPEAYEEQTWGVATFRVRKKIFAMIADEPEGTTASLKVSREDQVAMLAQGSPFFFPPYVGSKGWIGIDLRS